MVYRRSTPRARVTPTDRLLWAWLSKRWSRWREVSVFVQPATVIAWQRRRFPEHWTRLSRRGVGRPQVDAEVRDLIRKMSRANVTWGAPRIVGELGKIGIDVAKATVEKYMIRQRRPSWPPCKTFLKNHVKDIAAIDFFVVPTVRFAILFVFIVLAHERRRVLHFNITANLNAPVVGQ
jgi:putative transposase